MVLKTSCVILGGISQYVTQQEFIKFPGGIFQCNLYTYVRILVPRTSWRPLFEVLGHFWVLTTFLIIIAVTYSCPSGNDCNFRWFKAFKRESSNLLVNRKSPEVLKSRTSNPSSAVPPGPRAQAPGGSGNENGMCAGLGMVFELTVLK